MIIKPNPRNPFNRTQQHIVQQDGRKNLRCRGPHNPVWFFDQNEGMKAIDIANVIEANSKMGNMQLRSKLPYTCGVLGGSIKTFGIRRDDDQKGEKAQFEVDVRSLTVDGIKSNLKSEYKGALSVNVSDMEDYRLQSTRQFTRIYIPYSGMDSFELELFIHGNGMTVEQRSREFWFWKGEALVSRIRIPDIYDPKDFNVFDPDKLSPVIDHALEPVIGGWIYKKFNTVPLRKLGIPVGYLIDGDIYYSGTNDCYISLNNSNYTTCRNAVNGQAVDYTGQSSSGAQSRDAGTYYNIRRNWFVMDFSGVGEVDSALISIYQDTAGQSTGWTWQSGAISNPPVKDDYERFSGSELCSTRSSRNVVDERVEDTFNATGIALIEGGGSVVFCARDYAHDAINSAPSNNVGGNIRFTDYTGTDYDPYVDVTIVEASGASGRRKMALGSGLQL
jgi:hypothetical protein